MNFFPLGDDGTRGERNGDSRRGKTNGRRSVVGGRQRVGVALHIRSAEDAIWAVGLGSALWNRAPTGASARREPGSRPGPRPKTVSGVAARNLPATVPR